MQITEELFEARFLKRLNRFTIQVAMNGVENAYLPNPGRLKELLRPRARILLAKEQNPVRKTRYDGVAVLHNDVWVCIDSRIPNQVIREEITRKRLPEFKNYERLRPEFRFNHSRFDFLLNDNCILEVKGCTLIRRGLALFPDAPTERGARHLRELIDATKQGYRACILFLVQRPDADRFAPNDSTDPDFAATLRKASVRGVEVIAYTSTFTKGAIKMGRRIPVELKPAGTYP